MKRLGKVRTWQRFAQSLPHQAHKRPPKPASSFKRRRKQYRL